MTEPYWQSSNGQLHNLSDMTRAHLERCCLTIEDAIRQKPTRFKNHQVGILKSPNPWDNPWYCLLKMELHKRYYNSEEGIIHFQMPTWTNNVQGVTLTAEVDREIFMPLNVEATPQEFINGTWTIDTETTGVLLDGMPNHGTLTGINNDEE